MHRTAVITAVLALASGLAGAFAYAQLFGEAGAAPPVSEVREQNLDADGLIRVHEQGTANVNVTNASLPVSGTVDVGNLPAVQDVNVANSSLAVSGTVDVGNLPLDIDGDVRVSAAPPSGRLTVVAEGLSLAPGQAVTDSFQVNTADCRQLVVFTKHSPLINELGLGLLLSADGTSVNGAASGVRSESGDGAVFQIRGSAPEQTLLTPKVAGLLLHNASAATTVVVDKVWLFCAQ